MKRYDKIVFYACCLVLLLMGFAGGVITAIFTIWILFFNGGV